MKCTKCSGWRWKSSASSSSSIRWSTRASTARRARWRCGYRRRMPSRWSFLIRGASRSTGAWRNWTSSASGTKQGQGNVYTCGGGHRGCAIDPSGRMSICVLSHKEGYDIRQGSFREGWEGPLGEIRSRQRAKTTICSRCRIQSLCSMCAANGELESGDAESPVISVPRGASACVHARIRSAGAR